METADRSWEERSTTPVGLKACEGAAQHSSAAPTAAYRSMVEPVSTQEREGGGLALNASVLSWLP